MISDKMRNILLNRALKEYNVSADDIFKQNRHGLVSVKKKGKEDKEYYYNVYTFKTKETYTKWREWAESLINDESFTKMDLDMFELIWGLKEEYITNTFKKEK